LPYALLKMLKGEKPYLDKSNRMPKEQAKFLMKRDHMKGKYLGECLDSCRWGSQMTVMYEMSINEMIGFIQNWMQQNSENFTKLWHETKIEELYEKFELPYINHKTCPRDENHSGIVRDLGGRLRCFHKSEQKLKPSFTTYFDFFDDHSRIQRRNFSENEPHDSIPEDAWAENGELAQEYEKEWKEHLKELKQFKNAKASLSITDVCYAILSDESRILPLETIIKRLNLRPATETVYCNYDRFGPCKRVKELSESAKEEYELMGRCIGHTQPHDKVEFPFDGWDLALYAQKWHQQTPDSKSPVFEK